MICKECKQVNDHIGSKINGIIILKYIKTDSCYNKYYECKCFCGNTFTATWSSINSGHTKSCGCVTNKYGEYSKDDRFKNWSAMIQRVTNPNNESYEHYHKLIQGKIIEDKWVESPKCFYDEIGYKPDNSYSIDRIDNHKGYVKGNVRWADRSTQQNNRDTKRGYSNHKYIYFDKRRKKYLVYGNKRKIYLGQFETIEEALDAKAHWLSNGWY